MAMSDSTTCVSLRVSTCLTLLLGVVLQLITSDVTLASDRIRQNFHTESEANINRLINQALKAEYLYIDMGNYFSRDDVAFLGLVKLIRLAIVNKRKQSEALMTYQNARGGRVVFRDIAAPVHEPWNDAVAALQSAIDSERELNQSILDLTKVADRREDAHLKHWLENTLLNEQVAWIKQLGDLLTQLKRSGPGLGEFIVKTIVLQLNQNTDIEKNSTDVKGNNS